MQGKHWKSKADSHSSTQLPRLSLLSLGRGDAVPASLMGPAPNIQKEDMESYECKTRFFRVRIIGFSGRATDDEC